MLEARRRQAEEIFQEAADAPPAARQAILHERCADDQELLEEVKLLLHALDLTDGFLERPAYTPDSPPADAAPEPEVPTRIGSYRILRAIGQGGMGSVFEAWQDSPRRAVAIKIMHPGLLSRELLRRFHREAELLGALHHPCIASIFEAGTATVFTPSGSAGTQPFFAMELIRGLPLLDHAQSTGPDIRARLALFARICDGVHHAHQMGVIHRDLKPANILVDASSSPPQPKILDFGVARATESDLRTINAPTGAGVLLGTVPYMSPEQVSGNPAEIDARTDIYSLGVILFELLTGHLPLPLRGRSIPDAARIIRDEEPSRLSSINPALRGDLETITQKALEKDAARRYPSAADLAADIRRHLDDQPIAARPASTLYQFRKFARRNRALVGGIAATIGVLIAGVLVASFLAVRAADHRRRADLRSAEAERQAYRSSISAVQLMLQNHRALAARASLDATPQRLRGWEWRFLSYLSDRSQATLHPDDAPAVAAAVSEDGSRIAVGTRAGSIQLWELPSCRSVARFPAGIGSISSVALSSDAARLLASGTALVMLDTTSGNPVWRREYPAKITPFAFSPDGATVAVFVDNEPRIEVLDAESGESRRTIKLPVAAVSPPVFSPTADFLACSVNRRPVVFDASSGDQLWQAPETIKFANPDPLRFIDSGASLLLRDWSVLDARTGIPTGRVHTSGEAGLIDADRLVVALAQNTALVDRDTGKTITVLAQQSPVALTPDGRLLITGAQNGDLKVWDPAVTDAPLAVPTVVESVFSASFSADGSRLVTGNWGFCRAWNVHTGAEEWARFTTRRTISAVALSPDDRFVAAGALGGAVRILDASDGTLLPVRAQLPERENTRSFAWDPHAGRVLAATASPRIYAIDTTTGAVEVFAEVPGAVIDWIVASPTGLLAAGITSPTGAGKVRLWDVASGVERWTGAPSAAAPVAGIFTPDSHQLLVSTADALALSYDTSTGASRNLLTGREAFNCAAFSPEGRLATGNRDGTISIWDPSSGDELLVLTLPARTPGGNPESLRALRFTPDGRALLASATQTALLAHETSRPETGYAGRDIARRVRQTIDPAYQTALAPDAVIAALHQRAGLDPALRAECERVAQLRGPHVTQLNNRAWEVVRYAGRRPEECAQALLDAQSICRVAPDDWSYLNTLGIAQYRTGDYAAALATLERSEQLATPHVVGPIPGNLLFIAMSSWRLGLTDQATTALSRGRELLASTRSVGDAKENEAFLREAEALISGSPSR